MSVFEHGAIVCIYSVCAVFDDRTVLLDTNHVFS